MTTDLIDKYKQGHGAWGKFLLAEPFTKLKCMQVENLLEDMREKAAEPKVRDSGALSR